MLLLLLLFRSSTGETKHAKKHTHRELLATAGPPRALRAGHELPANECRHVMALESSGHVHPSSHRHLDARVQLKQQQQQQKQNGTVTGRQGVCTGEQQNDLQVLQEQG